MPSIVRIGDANGAGGVATGGVPRVIVNGRPISVNGDSVTPHPCCGQPGCAAHCSAVTTLGSSRAIAGGIPIQYIGCPDSCGHSRAQGSPNSIVGP